MVSSAPGADDSRLRFCFPIPAVGDGLSGSVMVTGLGALSSAAAYPVKGGLGVANESRLEELVVAVASLLREAPEPIAPERVVDVARVLVATVESLVHRLVATSRPVMDVRRFRDELVTMVHGYVESSRPEREAIDR